MKMLWYVAWRYTFSSTRESKEILFFRLFSIIGVALAVSVIVIGFSIGSGFKDSVEKKFISLVSTMTASHILGESFKYDSLKINTITSKSYVESVSAVWETEGILKTYMEERIEPILIKGISDSHKLKSNLIAGKFPTELHTSKYDAEVALGIMLAQKLNVKIGDIIILILSGQNVEWNSHSLVQSVLIDAMGKIKIFRLQIVGLIETGLADGFDDKLAIMSALTLQSKPFFNKPNTITNLEITIDQTKNINEAITEIEKILDYPYIVISVYDTYRAIFSWLKFQQNITPVLLIAMMIVAGLNMFTLLLITVLMRRKVVGVLSSFGMKPSQLKAIFLIQSFIIAFVGILIGNVISFTLLWAQQTYNIIKLKSSMYLLDHVPVDLNPVFFIWVSLATLAVCIISSWIPSTIATRFSPADTLKNSY